MTMKPRPVFLASRSPRRAQLLEQLDISFQTLDVDIAEAPTPGERAEDYVRRLAREKAGAGLLQVVAVPGACVIGSDTEVVLDGHIFGKPGSAEDAAAMLRRLSGREHEVMTAVAVITADRELEALSISAVRFTTLDDATIAHYIASGEPFGKAGGYAIQGRAAAFIDHLAGSYSGVMGLPLHHIATLLGRMDSATTT
jgi:septum formation protein